MKNQLWVFVNCLIENPTFDSQTKENMTLQAKSFGSKVELPESFTKKVSLMSKLLESMCSGAAKKAKQQNNAYLFSGTMNSRI